MIEEKRGGARAGASDCLRDKQYYNTGLGHQEPGAIAPTMSAASTAMRRARAQPIVLGEHAAREDGPKNPRGPRKKTMEGSPLVSRLMDMRPRRARRADVGQHKNHRADRQSTTRGHSCPWPRNGPPGIEGEVPAY